MLTSHNEGLIVIELIFTTLPIKATTFPISFDNFIPFTMLCNFAFVSYLSACYTFWVILKKRLKQHISVLRMKVATLLYMITLFTFQLASRCYNFGDIFFTILPTTT